MVEIRCSGMCVPETIKCHGDHYKELFIVESQRIVCKLHMLLMSRIFVSVLLMLHMK